jgi:Tol biopolymer transport system component
VYWLAFTDLLPTRLLFGSISETDPAWSPDGTWIAFASLDEKGDSIGLFLRNPDGVNRIQLSDSADRWPSWSPDGKKLAFVSTRDTNEEIYVLELGQEGPLGQAVRVTDTPGRDFAPDWSPNGKRIAFLSDRNGNVDVLTVSDEGENVKTLTRNEVDEISARWGPDGRIVFESTPSGKSDLFVMDTGGEQRQITTGDQPSAGPDW